MRRNVRRNVKHIKQRSKRNIRRRSSKKNVKRSVKRSVKRLSINKKRSSRRSNRKRIINKKNRTNRRMRGGDDNGTEIPVVVRLEGRQWKNSGETAGSYGGNRDIAKMKQETTKASRDNTGETLRRLINSSSDQWYVLDFLEDVLKKPVLDPELRRFAKEKLEEQKKICHEWNQAIYYGFYDGWPGGGGIERWRRVRGTGRRKDEFKHFYPYSEENFKKLHKLVTEENLRASNIDFIVAEYLNK